MVGGKTGNRSCEHTRPWRLTSRGDSCGLVKGDLTEDEIAQKVVREFFQALIDGDHDMAGLIDGDEPGEKLRQRLGQTKFVRIIEIGKPRPPSALIRAIVGPEKPARVRVPAKLEVEIKGRREASEIALFVRSVYGQPNRRVISGGW